MDNYQSKHQQMISGLQSHADYYGSFTIVMLSNHVGFLKANNAHKWTLQPSKEKDENTHLKLSCLTFGIMMCDQCDKGKSIGVMVAFPIDAIQISFVFQKIQEAIYQKVH